MELPVDERTKCGLFGVSGVNVTSSFLVEKTSIVCMQVFSLSIKSAFLPSVSIVWKHEDFLLKWNRIVTNEIIRILNMKRNTTAADSSAITCGSFTIQMK